MSAAAETNLTLESFFSSSKAKMIEMRDMMGVARGLAELSLAVLLLPHAKPRKLISGCIENDKHFLAYLFLLRHGKGGCQRLGRVCMSWTAILVKIYRNQRSQYLRFWSLSV